MVDQSSGKHVVHQTEKSNECKAWVAKTLAELSDPYLNMMVDDDQLLYHYTDAQGLLGIVENGVLWATDAAFLNDPVEMHHSANLMCKTIEFYCIENPHGMSVDELAELQMLPMSTAHNTRFRERVGFDTYALAPEDASSIISFSTNSDLLLLWREYADRGNGYAIGFLKKDLDGQIFSGTPVSGVGYFSRVLYDDDQKNAVIRDVIFNHFEYYRNHHINFDTTIMTLDNELKRLLPLLKPEDYAHEQEVRHVGRMSNMANWSLPRVQHMNSLINGSLPKIKVDPMDVVFTTKNGVIVPRIKLSHPDSRPLPIQEIVIGPSINQNIAEVGVRRLCDRYFHQGMIPVKLSQVKYRSHF